MTPSRLAISLATSTSKPFQVLVCTSYHDCGLYFGSVATRSVPLEQTSASASPVVVSAEAHTPVPLPPDGAAADVVEVSLEHAAPIMARTARPARATRGRNLIMRSLLRGPAEMRARTLGRTIGPRRRPGNATGRPQALDCLYACSPRPGWRNWQTRGTQNPVSERACGFDPRSRHLLQPLFWSAEGVERRTGDDEVLVGHPDGLEDGDVRGVGPQRQRRGRDR